MADRIINASILKSQPKINFSANNIISNIEINENETYFSNESIFNGHFSLFTSINGNYENKEDFRNDINTNNYLPEKGYEDIPYYSSFGTIVEPHYVYIKIKIPIDKLFSGSGLNIDIKQSGVNALPMGGNKRIDYIKNLVIGTDDGLNSNFNQYKSIYDFEHKWFGYIKNQDGNYKLVTLNNTNIINCGIVLNNNSADILLLLTMYTIIYQGTANYLRYQQYCDIDIKLNVLKTKNIVRKYDTLITKSDYVINSNELMQTNTTINGISIGQHIANNIIEQYKNGKATMTCSVNINDGTPLFVVGEIAKVYGFDGKSVSRNRDGTDKRFKITSAEWRWAGQETQNLEMVEVIN